MGVPKTTVYKDSGFESGQDYIRTTGQVSTIKSKPEAGTMEGFSYEDLNLRIATTNTRHYLTALFSRKNVHSDLDHKRGGY
jgi:hypothetical protein